ncbi:23S rRNA (guanosine(2251)-2'-O)-methyltransferase RlmB [Bacteroidia bacterium]|nr:23S rRNA (guanosine(2251)-2'-O)-methyltransferase RlmB [Bacteroidia bacterium]
MDNLIFGIRPVLEAIEAGRQVDRVFFRKEAQGHLQVELRGICRQRGIDVQEVPPQKLDHLVRGNHQGVVARMASIAYLSPEEMLAGKPEDETPLVVVLDGVTDVRNFGAIARSAECAGAHGIIVPLKNGAPVNAEAIRSSAGALTRIPVCRTGSIRNTVKMLQSHGLQVIAATEKSSELLFDTDMTLPTAIIMGNEEKGISRETLKLCDRQVAIPMIGAVQSLNVSAAAAVMLFEAVRQRIGESVSE